MSDEEEKTDDLVFSPMLVVEPNSEAELAWLRAKSLEASIIKKETSNETTKTNENDA